MKRRPFADVAWLNLLGTAAVLLIVIEAVRFVLGAGTAIKGNIHDFFIPLNAGYVVMQEGLAHPSLHSPFGVVYFLLSWNSLRLIEALPQWLSPDKIHMVSSLQWMALVTALFFAFRKVQDRAVGFPAWLLAVLLLITVQAKSVEVLNPLPNWYGTYNYHLWALLILQAANHYAWKGGGPKGARLAWLGALEAVLLVIAFNYKVSFFVAGCGFALLPMWYLAGWRERGLYYGSLLATGAGLMALLIVAGLPIAAYLQDLVLVARAKSVESTDVIDQAFAVLAFTVIAGQLDDGGRVVGQGAAAGWRIAALVRRYGFHAVVAGGLALGALGDFFVPWWPYAIVGLWALVCAARRIVPPAQEPADRRIVRLAAAVVVSLLAGFAMVSLTVSADNAYAISSEDRTVAEEIAFAPRDMRFVSYPVSTSFRELAASGLVVLPTAPAQALFDYSYRGDTHKSSPAVEAISGMVSADFVKDVNATAAWLREQGGAQAGSLVIAHVGFANPWPLLTGNRFPAGSLHWMHVGTTVTLRRLAALMPPLAAADVVVVPLVSVNDPEQVNLDCAFYDWNIRNGSPFVAQHLAGYNLIFLRRDGRLPPVLPEPVRQDRAAIVDRCAEVAATATDAP